MPSVSAQLDAIFREAIRAATGLDADPLLTASTNPQFGDFQSNAAMGLAKQAKSNPRQLATAILDAVKPKLERIASDVAIAGPGFINVRLDPAFVAAQLDAQANDASLGIESASRPQTVVIDYGGPNVAKQMHVGHLRSTIIGDAIARVLSALGHKVIAQNHVGDWGTQFGMLIAYLRSSEESAESRIEDLDKFYKQARAKFDADPAFADEARATVVRLQSGDADTLSTWQSIVGESRRHFEPIFASLGVRLTRADEAGESSYNPMLAKNVADLKAAGVATLSEGAIVAFTPGIEAPLMIEKSNGGYGYGITDLSAVRHRVGTLGADRVVYVIGTPQNQHLKQVFDVAKRAGFAGEASLEHAAFGSVLGKDGKMFKARSGESVKLADLLAEAQERALAVVTSKNPDIPESQRRDIAHAVGIGAVKYADLSKDRLGDYTFDFDTMLAMEGNTAPYLQYANARIHSIFRKAGGRGDSKLHPTEPAELSLAKQLLGFGDVIALVARELKPHLLCAYLYEVATKFSAFYDACPVVKSEEPIRGQRLALCELTSRVLASGLDLLGIEHPEQM